MSVWFVVRLAWVCSRLIAVDSPWKSISCLEIMKVRFAGCLRLICIAVVGLGAVA